MTKKKTPHLQQGGTMEMTNEFTRLMLELAALNPDRAISFGERMVRETQRRSHIPNK